MARSYTKDDEPVPGFRLVQFLGRGGFGEVWKATAPGGTEAAIKIINLSGKQGLKEFRAIRLVKRIRHPNLVPLYAFWLKDDQGNLLADSVADQTDSSVQTPAGPPRGTMAVRPDSSGMPRAAELIIAMGLGEKNLLDRMEECQRLDQPGIPADELLNYMEDSAKAIDFLNGTRHDMGSGPVAIQHCDIKPQNIMIVGGAAQLCDFGLARVLSGDIRTSLAAVSPAYGAPECLKSNQPSQSTDQYSLAVSYIELRTGQLPFDGDSYPAVINAHLNGTLNLSQLSESERKVIQRATALDPKDRFPSSMEMVRALRRAVEGRRTEPSAGTSFDGMIAAGIELVPGYKLVNMLGRGGFGEVWEATAPGGKHVAVKIIRNLDGVKGKREFKALELIKSVDHNHLMELHAYWLLDGNGAVIPDEQRDRADGPTPSMLVIAGKLANKNLLQRLEECRQQTGGGIPVPELLHYMRQSAEAIDYLNSPQHLLGDRVVSIQHRDIKPENILLAADIVKVGDFGLAKVVEGTASVIHADSRGLTLAYAAPEVLRGEVTRWTDQYSLAVTYYQLRIGELPFDPSTSPFELMELHRNGRLDFSRLPESERTVIARATAVDAERRFATCTEMVLALDAACGVAAGTSPVRIARMPAVEQGRVTPGASSSTPTGPYIPTDSHAEPEPAAERDWRGTMVSPAAAAEPAAPARSFRETAPLAPTSTMAPKIESPAQPHVQVQETYAYSKPRRFPLSLLAACLVVAIGGGYLVWSVFSGPSTTPIVAEGGNDNSGKGKLDKSGTRGTGNGGQDQTADSSPDLEPAVRRLVTSHKFSEAIQQVNAVKDAGKRKQLNDLVRNSWVETIEEAVQGNELESAVEQCNGFLKHFASDLWAEEFRGQREKSLPSLLLVAESNLEKDVSESLARFQRLRGLLTEADAPELRVQAAIGFARALARQSPPPLDEIRGVMQSDLHDRSEIPDGHLAHALAVEAIAVAPNPKATLPRQLDDALEILRKWDREPRLADRLETWERDRCAAIVKEAGDRAKKSSLQDVQALAQRVVNLGFSYGSEMAARVQERIPFLSLPKEFVEMLQEIEQAPSSDMSDGWVLACRAECLLRQHDNELLGSPIEREEATKWVTQEIVAKEAGGYGLFVRGLALQAESNWESATAEYTDAFKKQDPSIEPWQNQGRRNLAARAYLETGKMLEGLDQPIIEKALSHYKLALALHTDPPVDYQIRIARTALAATPPDYVIAQTATETNLSKVGVSGLGANAHVVLLQNAQARAGLGKLEQSLARYAELIALRRGNLIEAAPDVFVYEVIEPAIEVGEKLLMREDMPSFREQLAAAYGAKGASIYDNSSEPWNYPNAIQEAAKALKRAIDLHPTKDRARAEYLATHGFVMTKIQPIDIPAILQDAEEATQADGSFSKGWALKGFGFYQRAYQHQVQSGPSSTVAELTEQAIDAHDKAIDRAKTDGASKIARSVFLTNRSVAYVLLGNNNTEFATQRETLERARRDAYEATQLNPFSDNAFGALGNALEDISWSRMGKQPENYQKAIDAFVTQSELRIALPGGYVNLGRCYLKWVLDDGGDEAMLAPAALALNTALNLDPAHAEANYWMGRLLVKNGKRAEALQRFAKALAHPHAGQEYSKPLLDEVIGKNVKDWLADADTAIGLAEDDRTKVIAYDIAAKLRTRAALLDRTGRDSPHAAKAVEYHTEILKLAPDAADAAERADGLAQALEFYGSQKNRLKADQERFLKNAKTYIEMALKKTPKEHEDIRRHRKQILDSIESKLRGLKSGT